ncbi:hypothetical protein C357_04417 [Citreicella sp. 357]|nr:hypothetical protein C357_04417 [Citreicella sp. 357]
MVIRSSQGIMLVMRRRRRRIKGPGRGSPRKFFVEEFATRR